MGEGAGGFGGGGLGPRFVPWPERRSMPRATYNCPMNQNDLRHLTELTLAHYERNADAFWTGTRDHDVSQNINALLSHIAGPAPFVILDFGCGPGRDLKIFAELGHRAIGLDGSARFVERIGRASCRVR